MGGKVTRNVAPPFFSNLLRRKSLGCLESSSPGHARVEDDEERYDFDDLVKSTADDQSEYNVTAEQGRLSATQ